MFDFETDIHKDIIDRKIPELIKDKGIQNKVISILKENSVGRIIKYGKTKKEEIFMDDKLYDFKNMDADNIFEALKNISEETDVSRLSAEEKNLLLAINSSFESGQARLLEKSLFLYECIEKERYLLSIGINKYINSEHIDILLENLNDNVSNDKMIFLCDLDEFPRIIPKDIVKKIKKIKEKKIFDAYYVLYTDYTKRAKDIAKGNTTNKSKDPILFGVFTKMSKDKNVSFLNEKMYVIADWVDEYCDLTLDKLMSISPDSVHSIYGDEDSLNKIEKEDLERLEETQVGKEILDTIKKSNKDLIIQKSLVKNKTLFDKLKNFLKR